MSALTGTGKLIRLILRRDRFILPVWVILVGLVPSSYVASIEKLYPTAAERQAYADSSAASGGFVALYGRPWGAGIGDLVAWRSGFIPIMVGLISLLMVIRHTRTEEEAGRRELVGATVVGRHAGLAAALITTILADLVLALILAGAMSGKNLSGAGSLALGLELAAGGMIFAAVGAVAAQLSHSAGKARGIALVTLGGAYLLRMVGDISAQNDGPLSWLSWVSPLGWLSRFHPFTGTRWWIMLLVAGATVLLVAVAGALAARRDLGAGLLPDKPGPVEAASGLRSPLSLAWRLHRGLLLGWVAGFIVLGVVLGGVAKSIGDQLDDNDKLKDVFARLGGKGAVVDAYFVAILGLMALIAAAYAIQTVLKLRDEESSGRAEPVLASAHSRLEWAASHLLFSLIGPALAMIAGGLAAGLTHGLNTGEVGHQTSRVLGGALVQLPAVWVLSGLTVALFGLLPRVAPVVWGVLGLCVLISLVGPAVQMNQKLLDVSPFTHVPKVPGHSVAALPLVVLLAVAVVLGLLGLSGLRRRNIPST